MRKAMISLLLAVFYSLIFAQEGPQYMGIEKANEKLFNVKHSFGKPGLILESQSTLFYDSEGNIIEKYIMQANKTYKGKVIKNIVADPPRTEILTYNHMDLLTGRQVEYADTLSGESTRIDYDAKGKVLSKVSTRKSPKDSAMWEMHYNQVGYVSNYFRVMRDSTNSIREKHLFDYKDDLLEIHLYSYDAQGLLIGILALSPQDSVIFKQEYQYDENANLIEEARYDSAEQILESTQYFYDDMNRLIQRSEYHWNPRFGRIPQLQRQAEYNYM